MLCPRGRHRNISGQYAGPQIAGSPYTKVVPVLKVGRSPVRVPDEMDFFLMYLILPAAL
jgi:hypothetical protein